MKNHPDKGGDPEQFKKIQGAYEILSDPQKRANFDQFGTADAPPQNPFPADIFSQMFGGAANFGSRGPVKRSNFDHEMKISLEEAYRGTSRNMKITLEKTCFTCKNKCPNCHGRGQVSHQMGPMMFNQPCPMCGGEGGLSRGCGSCQGGRKQEVLNLELKIPPGVETGNILTGHGLGEQPKKAGENPGDIVFHIKINEHPVFLRQGLDLVYQTKISFEDSVNGKNITIPHFDGDIIVSTTDWGVLDPREDYIIPSKGFKVGDAHGKLRVQFNVIYPNSKTKFILSKIAAQ